MPVYFDHNATTPLSPEALEAMMPYLNGIYGNSSSVHRYGRITRDALEQARSQVAQLVGAQPSQLVFTSGGTEANNLAMRGGLGHCKMGRFAVSAIEHASMQETAKAVQKQGWQMDEIAVNTQGQIEASHLQSALKPDTRLVSIMSASNETGVLQNIKDLCKQIKSHDEQVLFHSDACQLAGKHMLNFDDLQLDLMSLSSHKLYGPQGVGALVMSASVDLMPQITGGGQEKKRRSGTENIAAIVGFGRAAELAAEKLDERQQHSKALRQALLEQLHGMDDIVVFSDNVECLPNTLQFSLAGIDGEALLMQLDRKGFAVSSGSACDSGSTEPSHVLTAMAVGTTVARGAIRVSFGEQNTIDEVTRFIEALKQIKQQFN